MKSRSSKQQSRYGTLTLSAKLGWYEVLEWDRNGSGEKMAVVVPVKPTHRAELAEELRAIAKRLEKDEVS